jgi:outer membrane protein OmpA-like peptidoglycan-associated protein
MEAAEHMWTTNTTARTPRASRRILALAAAGALCLAGGLAACSGSSATHGGATAAGGGHTAGGGHASSGTTKAKAPEPDDVVATRDIGYGINAHLHLKIHPVVREGKYLLLTIDIDAEDPKHDMSDGSLGALDEIASGYSKERKDAKDTGILLMNLKDDKVAPPALDGEGDTVRAKYTGMDASTSPTPSSGKRGALATEHLQLTYGDPGGDSLSVFMPKAKVIEDLPVISGTAPDIHGENDLFGGPEGASDVKQAPVDPLTSYALDTASHTRTQVEGSSETISLSGDVLFDPDSSTLSSDAKATIASAVEQVKGHEPGPVSVTGATDNVKSAEHNQKLSEARAKAVAKALSSQIDTNKYPLKVSGIGESHPVGDNSTDEGKALNRRVELKISTPLTSQVQVDPASDENKVAATGTAAKGVQDPLGGVPTKFTSPGARMVNGHLVVTLHALRTDKTEGVPNGLNFNFHRDGMSQNLWLEDNAGGIAFMNGSLATLPALYKDTSGASSSLLPVADVATTSRFDGGQTRTFDLVYPRGVKVGDTVSVEAPGDWKLTDIPVKK